MSNRVSLWPSTALQYALLLVLLLPLAACHSKTNPTSDQLLQQISQKIQPPQTTPSPPGKMAADGSALITTQCAVQSYANASKGLIAGETGLHEDVFALRDRTSYQSNVYSLDEALKLEALQRAEAQTTQSPSHSTGQTTCIQLFEQHFESLTDPLVQQDKALKDLDVSAFNDSRKEAEQQLEKPTTNPAPH